MQEKRIWVQKWPKIASTKGLIIFTFWMLFGYTLPRWLQEASKWPPDTKSMRKYLKNHDFTMSCCCFYFPQHMFVRCCWFLSLRLNTGCIHFCRQLYLPTLLVLLLLVSVSGRWGCSHNTSNYLGRPSLIGCGSLAFPTPLLHLIFRPKTEMCFAWRTARSAYN